MRTTITLDESTAELIKEEMKRTGKTFKETVNESIRAHLTASKTQPKVPFKIKPVDLGLRPGLNYDKVWQLFEDVEGPDYP